MAVTQKKKVEKPSDIDTKIEDDTSSIQEQAIRYNITSYGWDSDIDGLIKRLDRDDIHVPTFQRKYVWNGPDRSRFVESLILGLPIPSIFLAEDSDTKKLNIIDGQQRLKTLRSYFHNEFSLNATNIQDSLKGRHYAPAKNKKGKALSAPDKRTLDNAIVHAVVVRPDSTDPNFNKNNYNAAIIQIFKRLNTTGKPLQAQEVRACIFHGSLHTLLGKLNADKNWRLIFGLEHSRLKDMEAILRYFALLEGWASYKPPMPKFLDQYMEKNRNPSAAEMYKLTGIFAECIKLIYKSSGATVFKTGTTFQLSKFDAVMVGLSSRLLSGKPLSVGKVKKAIDKLLLERKYKYGTEKFVNDKDRVHARISAAIKIFKKI